MQNFILNEPVLSHIQNMAGTKIVWVSESALAPCLVEFASQESNGITMGTRPAPKTYPSPKS